MSRVWVNSISDIPKVEHWAIFRTGSINIPGDERSRTNPGHGYPAHTETFIRYEAFLNKEDWVKTIEGIEGSVFGKEPYLAVKVIPATVRASIKVDVKES